MLSSSVGHFRSMTSSLGLLTKPSVNSGQRRAVRTKWRSHCCINLHRPGRANCKLRSSIIVDVAQRSTSNHHHHPVACRMVGRPSGMGMVIKRQAASRKVNWHEPDDLLVAKLEEPNRQVGQFERFGPHFRCDVRHNHSVVAHQAHYWLTAHIALTFHQ